MKKAVFDIGRTTQSKYNQEKHERAMKDLELYRDKLHQPEITSYWMGMKEGEPYIMVTVEKGKVKDPDKLIPDKLGEYNVYYIEGHLHR